MLNFSTRCNSQHKSNRFRSVGLVIGHQGLGDFIICNGLYRFLATKHSHLIVLVTATKIDSVKQMLGDVSNIKIATFHSWFEAKGAAFLRRLSSNYLLKVYKLGIYGSNFWQIDLHFDENFYFQVGIPFEYSYESFSVEYNVPREEHLTSLKLQERSPYVLIHQDIRRGFLIDKSLIGNSLPCIEVTETGGFTLFDYRKLILGATEIHAIEGSLAAYVDRLPDVTAKLFAHRYARPEAASDRRLEFKYVKDWYVYHDSPMFGKKYSDPRRWIHDF